jgi:hypothetical protein
LFNAEGPTSSQQAGQLLERLGRELKENSAVQLEDVRIDVPQALEARVRYEETPHGALALRITLEWGAEKPEPENKGIQGLLR